MDLPRISFIAMGTLTASLLAGCATTAPSGSAAAKPRLPEADSPVNALYVEPSSSQIIQPGQKIGHLFGRGIDDPFIVQRIGQKTYWAHHLFYNSLFYVGEHGVLLIDPLQYRGDAILNAIRAVTPLPVSAIVYSHFHVDHIDDVRVFLDDARRMGVHPRIIASQMTADKMRRLGSTLPLPTETVDWPAGSVRFEGLTLQLHGFIHPAHVDDSSAWLLVEEKIVHAPDMLNPDQLPYMNFGGSENFINYEANLREIEALDWTLLSGGHGNIGSRADLAFYFQLLTDAKAALAEASAAVDFSALVDPAKANNHFAIAHQWEESVVARSMAALRPKYGRYYGFEASMPANLSLMLDAAESYH